MLHIMAAQGGIAVEFDAHERVFVFLFSYQRDLGCLFFSSCDIVP